MQRGDPGWVLHRQAILYAQEYDYNEVFETYCAMGLSRFLERFEADKDQLWVAQREGEKLGAIALQHDAQRPGWGQLRWFFVEPEGRGAGIGRMLMDTLVSFARQVGYGGVYLWTVDELVAARRLYEQTGFRLVQETGPAPWASWTNEQLWELDLGAP